MRIHQLPPLIANQIAAGEVIERPASVVKELLENCLDAGAEAINIEIGYGGLNLIKVSDNGLGIIADDLPLAVAAHATSKINTLNDLYAIGSMGFRGEALASIASIAKVNISSKTAEQDTAMMLKTNGTQIALIPCARTIGTTVEVIDLFYNAPVRKRFLKSEKLEFQAIESVVKRFALSAPNIALTLSHNGKQILFLPAAINDRAHLTRLTRILGSSFVKEAVYLDVERGAMRLYGWISGLNFQRSQNDRQWVYINQRMVKDKLINHAIKQAYEELLYPGRFPACVLYLTIEPAEVDVNVHPTKHEVRFQQPRLVHDFFTSQITLALQTTRTVEKNVIPAYSVAQQPIQEVCEPYAQLIPSVTEEAPWVILNKRYVLAFIQQQPYVVDVLALQQQAIKDRLAQLDLPLASRPLLVPIRYSLVDSLKGRVPELINYLNQLGISFAVVTEHEILLRTIPLSVPYLDLRLFLDAVSELVCFELKQLLELMSQAQIFDPRLLSKEEKIELNQTIINSLADKKLGLFKALTLEDCRNLLDV